MVLTKFINNSVDKIKKEELMIVLKDDASNVSIDKIMKACAFLLFDARFIPTSYRKEYIHSYVSAFVIQLKDMKNDKNNYKGFVNKNELKNLLKVVQNQEEMTENKNELHFYNIYKLVVIYVTFLLEKPIHPVGTPFPGGFKVKYENGKYLCPVKDKQKDNPNAVCEFCIALQDEKMK